MNSGDLLRDIMVVGGITLLVLTTTSLARRHMTELFCLGWGMFSILLIIGGILLKPTGINSYISHIGLVLAVIVGTLAISAGYWMSLYISRLERENREQAMQMAILQAEQKRLLKKVFGEKSA